MVLHGFLPVAIAAFAVSAVAASAAERIHRTLASPLVDEGAGPDGCEPELTGPGGPVKWEVRIERYLPDGKALVETSRKRDDDRYPLCIAELPVAKNAEVELEFVPRAGTLARTAGIVVRFADAQDYYVVRADALAGDVQLLRVFNGTQSQLAGARVLVAQGKPNNLKVTVVDDLFTVWFAGKKLFEHRDGAIKAAGRFGVWSKSDSVTSFGDLFITVLD
jgi:hypothetical protein